MHSRRVVRAAALVALGAAISTGIAWAGPPPGRTAQPAAVRTIDVARRIDVNNINMFVSNEGSFAYDLANLANSGGEGLFYPKGTAKNAVFAAGPWISAIVDSTLFVTVAEYSDEYGPGNIVPGSATAGNPAGSSASHTDPNFIVYKVVAWSGDPADTAHVIRSAADLAADGTADPLVHHSWSEYMAGAVPYGAPWRLWRLPRAGSTTDSVDVPGPDMLGDMMCWSVYNDADPSLHTNEAGRRLPMGLEIQQTTFAFNRQGALGNTIFVKYKLYNRGLRPLRQMYFSQWVDPDLGGYTDDFVGCDTLPDRFGQPRSIGFCYNSNNDDQIYGSLPPAVGFDFMQGPKDSLGTVLPMTSFNKYINGTDPSSAQETRDYQLGLNADGTPVVDPFGHVTTFTNAGNPVSPGPDDWLDSNPADRRMMLSSGPFQMLPGDSQIVVVGLVIGQCGNNLYSIKSLDFNDDFAQGAFNEAFDVPAPPPQPKVTVSQYHDQITLTWDSASRFNYHQAGYAFEGYNVYQGASVAGPWHRLATYDEIDGIQGIPDVGFSSDICDTLPTVVAFGKDTGIQYSYATTQDAVLGGTLRDATQYYFAVTAYSYDPLGLPKVLEDAQQVVRVMPQRPPAGTNPATASVLPVTYLQVDPTRLPTTDSVAVDVVSQAQITGHTYKVTFQPTSPLFTGRVAGDTATVKYSWTLTDSTTGQAVLSGQLNRRGGTDYPVVDGIRVAEVGRYFATSLVNVGYVSAGPRPPAYQGNSNWGLSFFNGGAGLESDFGAFTSTLALPANADSFATVELRLGPTQKCYRYFRLEQGDGSPPDSFPDRGYPYGGFFDCPFQVWDTTHNVQLDAMFVERMVTDSVGTYLPLASQPASQDSTWDPGIDGDPGGLSDREYLVILTTPYSPTPKAAFTVNHLPLDGMPMTYFLGADLTSPTAVPNAGDKIVYTWANPAGPNDVFVFKTTKMVTNDAALARSNLARIRVVPNPYYAHSLYELNQFNHIVRFTNMPELCTVRIFNLAGQLVRTLHKTDPTSSVLEWDLLTENQLPVGSGVYIYQVDAGASGSTIGRIAVFIEKERLNNF